MKILYGIQGTGNGHLSRAIELIPYLKKEAEVDILISGLHHDLEFNHSIKFKKQGLGFFFGKNGGIDIWKTIRKFNVYRFLKDIKSLPVEEYDLVISDFEPVTSWACKLKKVFCLGLSHQSAMLNSRTPMPEKIEFLAFQVLKNYAPCNHNVSFHFKEYGHNMFTPVIRREIRLLEPKNNGYYLVYLPAYSDEKLISVLSHFPNIQWVVYSKHSKLKYRSANVDINPVNGEAFIRSLKDCAGVLCGAGFETPAESLYLGKKLAVIPMKNQFEQVCNAHALRELGIPVITDLEGDGPAKIREWIKEEGLITKLNYPDNAKSVIKYLMNHYARKDNLK
ncbi:glycosyltransferase family protein [Marinifilum sp. D737]|uniref:glycosyltransferase family protein n=1 Tax=Marinifilum sp. D737 TaxID=2969628 RepID=UPI002276DD3A|nr:glycosyltransferase family protein [Marinifilum sp. D737]MCY1634940.1 glycosyl transferase [Marinifilum sp. D737]